MRAPRQLAAMIANIGSSEPLDKIVAKPPINPPDKNVVVVLSEAAAPAFLSK